MKTFAVRRWLFGIAFVLLALVVGLWSWNTLAELFGLPVAGIKDVLAAGCLLWTLRWLLPRNGQCGFVPRGERHE